MAALNTRQQAFVDEYLIDLNASRAYAKVYRCTEESAGASGGRLLANAKVAAAIAKGMLARSEKTGIAAERVVQEAGRLAFSDLREIAEWDREFGIRFKASTEISDDAARAIQSVKSRTTRRVTEDEGEFETVELEVKLYPKDPSLTLLARHLGMLKDRIEVTGSLADLLTRARAAE